MTEKEKMLNAIFATAIDGGNVNAYRILISSFESLPAEIIKTQVSLENICNSLKPLSKKWEKEIDEVIGL